MNTPSRLLGVALLLLAGGCSDNEGSSNGKKWLGGPEVDGSVAAGDAGSDADTGGDGDVNEDAGPLEPDRDGDGVSDADELALGTDPDNPDSDGDGLSDGEELKLGTDPLHPDSDGDGWTDKEEVFLGTNPSGEGGGCAASSAEAVSKKRPVDVILIVDNSSSMSGEIDAIVKRINEDFAKILALSGVDYRLILLSRHGSIDHDTDNSCDDHGICIDFPLAASACDPHEPPQMTDHFKHYSICINSEDGLEKAMNSFTGGVVSQYFDSAGERVDVPDSAGGWSQWLRDGALRAFLMITDDRSQKQTNEFTTWLYQQEARYFGTAEQPNWVFHSIVGVKENTPETAPYLPDVPVITERCSGVDSNGRVYQELSRLSNGLRFPICKNENFDELFQAIAASVVEQTKLSCSFSPQASGTGDADYTRSLVLYESGAGARTLLGQVRDVAACTESTFYVAEQTIHLCPQICDTVEADLAGKIKTMVACYDEEKCGNGMLDSGEACDDGNRTPGDGCDADCRFEGVILF